ncbi:MAG TPA: hypothetical protein VFO41_09460 [Alphaproteobacteria bacterium]|nr:hypothetical protein [Alphaproteobacteria bacterium]
MRGVKFYDIKISMQGQKTMPLMVRLTSEQIDAIDAWRRLQKDPPSRPEAVRRFIDIAVSSESQRLHSAASKKQSKPG